MYNLQKYQQWERGKSDTNNNKNQKIDVFKFDDQ